MESGEAAAELKSAVLGVTAYQAGDGGEPGGHQRAAVWVMWVEHWLTDPHSVGLASLGSDHECGSVGYVGHFWVDARVRTLKERGRGRRIEKDPHSPPSFFFPSDPLP